MKEKLIEPSIINLFAAMSGVGGYEYNWLDSALFITYLSGARGDGTITDNTITINNVKVSSGVIETRVSSPTNVEDKTNYILTADGTTMVLRVGDELQPLNGTYSGTGGEMGFFISDYNHTSRFGSMAFYKSILFNAVPTKETDGFTEQDLIDYVLKNIITQ